MKAGLRDQAADCFRQALALWSDNRDALYGLGRCADFSGNADLAIGYFRAAVYSNRLEDHGYYENRTDRLMEFALSLARAGHRSEALAVYQHGYQTLPTDRGPLPPLFTTPDFAVTDFESAAYTAMGIYEMAWGVAADAPVHFDHAIASQPGLAVPYFYRGLELKGTPGRAADALAAFARAEQLGGPSVKPFVDKELKDGSGEFLAAVKKAQANTAP